MMGGQTPIIVLKEGTQRETGKSALGNNIAAAKAVAEAVRTTLGPKGMDKMLVDSMGDVVITNDGATILKEIDVEHPAAKMIIETAKTQDEECGDGTTTAVVLAGELLNRSQELVDQNVHPTIITSGFRMAADKAIEILNSIADKVSIKDEALLKNIAITSMTGKSAGILKEYLAEIAVKSVKAIVEREDGKIIADIDNIKVEKKQGGSIKDTSLIEGIIIDKARAHSSMPRTVKIAKIALVNAALEVKKTEVDAKIQIKSPEQLRDFVDEEARMLKEMAVQVKESGANVLLCQKGIDDLAQHYLARAGIFAINRVSESDMKKLAKATGGRIVLNLKDLSKQDLGNAGKVEQQKIGSDEMTFVMECPKAKAVSIIVRGGTEHVIDEIERGLHDGLSVVATAIEDGKVNTGGGSAAIEISQGLREYATTIGGREQMAVEAFATAIEVIPRSLAENAGLDQIETLINLRKAHKKGLKAAGLNLDTGKVTDMKKANVIEPLRVGTQAIQSATDVAVMILRIDDVIAARSTGGPPAGMPPGGMGGMPPGMM
ncbi:MAG: TCP-1/cpn60 chaperonin family protein [Thermoplasmata archaeon]|nr:TCP-1/cpn60 chaperonin family protein [Thermoplasmata archaeon]